MYNLEQRLIKELRKYWRVVFTFMQMRVSRDKVSQAAEPQDRKMFELYFTFVSHSREIS